jgi:regulatory associated protein of mTOR
VSRPHPQYHPIPHLRSEHQQGVPTEYMLQQPLYLSPTHRGGPVEDFRMLNVGGQPVILAPQSQAHPAYYPMEAPRRHSKPTVYEDRLRLSRDLEIMTALSTCARDFSVLVRYEATIGLAAAVGKYLDAFVVSAEESALSIGPPDRPQHSYPLPPGFDRQMLSQFTTFWKTLRALQHDDPFPEVSKAASQVVSFVHEHLLRFRMDAERSSSREPPLDGIYEEDVQALPPSITGVPRTPIGSHTSGGGRSATTGRLRGRQELRRVASEVVTRDDGSILAPTLTVPVADGQTGMSASLDSNHPWSFELPKSKFYAWKKRSFDPSFKVDVEEMTDLHELDLLSPAGAARAYQERRNFISYKTGLEVESRFACLAPKPPKPKRRTVGAFLDDDGGDEGVDAALEEQISVKKRELKMRESLILRNEVKMTSMLHFHSYESLLVSCGGRGTVTLWDTRSPSGRRLTSFDAGNPETSRMTSSGWINEESASLFYVGCDDGSVRIWGGMVEESGGGLHLPYDDRRVWLRTAFTAVSMKAGDRGTSGLVCEWQPQTGLLVAGGNADVINAIDLESEREVCRLQTGTEANVTTLTTAWDADPAGAPLSSSSSSSHLIPSWGSGNTSVGPHILVSGHSDGSMKIFDLRAHCTHQFELWESPVPTTRRPRASRVVGYNEHTSWIVTTAFTSYSGRPELISGTLAGKVKSWDLRMPSSLRTVEVQRSPMTALAVHPKIPLLASGSHAQFIKLLTPDGDPLQVLRYHERLTASHNHRIGPVSCLAFHRSKPMLAAGSTDTHIGLFAP